MSVRHHEQLFAHQQREIHLMQSLQEVRLVVGVLMSLYSIWFEQKLLIFLIVFLFSCLY